MTGFHLGRITNGVQRRIVMGSNNKRKYLLSSQFFTTPNTHQRFIRGISAHGKAINIPQLTSTRIARTKASLGHLPATCVWDRSSPECATTLTRPDPPGRCGRGRVHHQPADLSVPTGTPSINWPSGLHVKWPAAATGHTQAGPFPPLPPAQLPADHLPAAADTAWPAPAVAPCTPWCTAPCTAVAVTVRRLSRP